jgi:hypothetical protein
MKVRSEVPQGSRQGLGRPKMDPQPTGPGGNTVAKRIQLANRELDTESPALKDAVRNQQARFSDPDR